MVMTNLGSSIFFTDKDIVMPQACGVSSVWGQAIDLLPDT